MTGSVHSALVSHALGAATLSSQGQPLTPLHATGVQDYAWLLLAFPLFGAAVLLLGGKRTNPWGHLLGVAMPVLAFGYGVAVFVQMLGYPAAERVRELTIYQWIDVARF